MTSVVAILPEPKLTAAARCDRWLGRTMFYLALAFLVLASGVIHRVGHGFGTYFEFEAIAWALFVLWPIFLVEGLLRLAFCVRQEKVWLRVLRVVMFCVAPPLRLGARSYADVTKMWLPGPGWCVVDRHLRRRLERFFSIPMMAMAVLILPVLALEYFWAEQVRAHFGAALFFDVATSVIWMAFAAEFILMLSVADKKFRYALQNWVDLAIVVLPLIDFLPVLRLLRLTRLLELQQLIRMGRLYRLRGLVLKLWRAILLLEVLHRLIGNRKEKRLLRLKELAAAKAEELADLNQEIEALQRELAAAVPAETTACGLADQASPPTR